MKSNVTSKVAIVMIASMLFLMNPLSAADNVYAGGQEAIVRLEQLLQAISTADEVAVKAQLDDIKNSEQLLNWSKLFNERARKEDVLKTILNKHTMYYSPLGMVNDYIQYFADDYGLDKAALNRIKQQLQQAGANLDYSSHRNEIKQNYLK